ncbi:hypothetical protein [Massilia endophytica]|uniref:hypothetical protein n=1 Tax=Massilia endophytica TaxID=2899220 RepID=UPI001E43B8AC|nr:hypothetical protein [Massilia endophytica]UGQ47106.1 hypothetical protein LSQ66_01095 [Massilia endophytica]
MRALTNCSILLLTLLAAGAAGAQTQTPPKLDKIDETDTPITVTTKPGAERAVTEKREGGMITESKVGSGKGAYTVKARKTNSTALPGDASGSGVRGPQWTVMEFDIAKKQKQRSEDQAAAADKLDEPPPPPAPPAKR